MFKTKLAGVTAAVALIGMATAGAAQAAYQDPTIVINVDDTTPVEGATIEVRAAADVDCDWSASFNGAGRTGAGNAFAASFDTPQVTEPTDFPLVVECEYDDTEPVAGPADSGTNLVSPAAIRTASRTVTITVLPAGGADAGVGNGAGAVGSGFLPSAGGANAELLWLGGGLLVVGAGITVAARRRSSTRA